MRVQAQQSVTELEPGLHEVTPLILTFPIATHGKRVTYPWGREPPTYSSQHLFEKNEFLKELKIKNSSVWHVQT